MGKMLDEVERDEVRKAAWAIIKMVPWVQSKKGVEYWQGVYEELIRISETGEP